MPGWVGAAAVPETGGMVQPVTTNGDGSVGDLEDWLKAHPDPNDPERVARLPEGLNEAWEAEQAAGDPGEAARWCARAEALEAVLIAPDEGWRIGPDGHRWTADRFEEVGHRLPEKLELVDGVLGGSSLQARALLGALVENLGLRAVLPLAPRAVWRALLAAEHPSPQPGREQDAST